MVSRPTSKPVAPIGTRLLYGGGTRNRKGLPPRNSGFGSAGSEFGQSLLVTFPLLLLYRGPLVVQFLALCQSDLEFDASFLPVEGKRYQGVTCALHSADQSVDFATIEQKLSGAGRVGPGVRGSRVQRGEVGAKQEQFPVSDDDIRLLQLCATGTQALYLPTLERDSGLEVILDMVIVPCFPVAGDGIRRGRRLFLFSPWYLCQGHAGASAGVTEVGLAGW